MVDRFDVRNYIDNGGELRKYRRFANQHALIDQSDTSLTAENLGTSAVCVMCQGAMGSRTEHQAQQFVLHVSCF
jgi:hypothetical protein